MVVALLHLAGDELRCYVPLEGFPASASSLEPLSEMGGKGLKIAIEPITGKEWDTARGQDPSEGVDHGMGGVLCARTQIEHGNNLGAWVDGQPEPQHLLSSAEPRAQFVQLNIGKLEMTENVLVKALSVLTRAPEPGGDRGLSVAEDPLGRGRVSSFGKPQTVPWRPDGKGFSNGTRECRVEH
jgi:hypothetical protein